MQEVKSIISELITLGKVDGTISDEEIALIKQMGNMLGLSDQELLDLFENPVPFDPQTSVFDRILQFHRLVLLMNVDGNPSDAEKSHIKLLGIKMGLNPNAIEEVLTVMHNYPNNVIPPNDLINIYKKHMN